MFADQFVSLTNGLATRFRVAAEMLLIGIAYQRENNLWEIISIEGDSLGTMSTFMVSETACMLKRAGLKSNAAKEFYRPGIDPQPAPFVTFAHDDKLSSVPEEVFREILDRRFKNPVNLV